MTNQEGSDLEKYREELLATEAPEVKAARKLFEGWASGFVPLYVLNDTPEHSPKNWEDSHIWSEIEAVDEKFVVNGYVSPEESETKFEFAFATGYYFTQNPCPSQRLTIRIPLTADTDCDECDDGEDEEGEECYLCYGSGSITVDFRDGGFLGTPKSIFDPQYVGFVKDLPDQPKSTTKKSAEEKKKFCIECGSGLVPTAKFCGDCGTAVS